MKMRALISKLFQKYVSLPVPVKASLWFMACSIVQKCVSLLTTPIFTRVMDQTQYGQFTHYNSWLNVICIFTTLNLQYGSFNTAQIKFGDDRKAYTASTQGLITVITLICIGFLVLFKDTFSSLLNLPTIVLIAMLCHIWGQFAIDIWLSNRRFDYQYKPMILLTLLLLVAGQGISLLCVLNTEEKGYARILSVAAVSFLVGSGIFIYNFIKGKTFCKPKYWKFALGFNLPLIPYYLSQVVFNTSDRIMISEMTGMANAGIYGLSHNIAFLLSFVISAVRNAYIPKFFQKIKENDGPTVHRTNTQLTVLMGVLLMLFIFVAPELLLIMGGRAYYEAVWIIPPLVVGLFFEYFTDYAANILFYYEQKWMLVLSTIGCAVVNVILNYFGIKHFGYAAAAWSTMLCYILFWLFLYLSARNVCRKNNLDPAAFLCFSEQCKLGLGFLVVSGLCLLLYLNTYLRYGAFALIMILVFLLRKKLIPIVKSILPFGK